MTFTTKQATRALLVAAIAFAVQITVIAGQAFAGAAQPLVIHASELGVGKFHRKDNKAHNYGANNAWTPYILADNASDQTPLVQKNTDGSVTIFFSNLDELLTAVTGVAKEAGRQVSVLNVHGHGLPGGMWYPKDAETQASGECADWRGAANSTDEVNYGKYYEPVPKYEIMMIRQMAENSGSSFQCTSGLEEWRNAVAAHTDLKQALSPDLQVHVLSCVVGLGNAGDVYTKGIANLLVTGGGHVTTSINFGLGDWSMPEGMGFWDYQNDEQLDRDNGVYPANKRDADIAQIGSVRVAVGNGTDQKSGIAVNQKFLPLGYETTMPALKVGHSSSVLQSLGLQQAEGMGVLALPTTMRLPGTRFTIRAR